MENIIFPNTNHLGSRGFRKVERSESRATRMFYVYLIQSQKGSANKYIGFTSDLKRRLRDHNTGNSHFTSKYKPWCLVTYIGFSDKHQALEFEKYLKGHSGRAFAEKRLW